MEARPDIKILLSLNLKRIVIQRNFSLTCSQVGKLTEHFLFYVSQYIFPEHYRISSLTPVFSTFLLSVIHYNERQRVIQCNYRSAQGKRKSTWESSRPLSHFTLLIRRMFDCSLRTSLRHNLRSCHSFYRHNFTRRTSSKSLTMKRDHRREFADT